MQDAWSRASRGEIPWSAFYLWAYLSGAGRQVSMAEAADTLPYSTRTIRTAAGHLVDTGLALRHKSGRQVYLSAQAPPPQYGVSTAPHSAPVAPYPHPHPEPPFVRENRQQAPQRPSRQPVEAPGVWREWLVDSRRQDGVRARVLNTAAEALALLWATDHTPDDLHRKARERVLVADNPLAVLACMVQRDGSLEPEVLRRQHDTPNTTLNTSTPPEPTEEDRRWAAAAFSRAGFGVQEDPNP